MTKTVTMWKVSKYVVFSGPNTGKYGPEKASYLDTFHAVCRSITMKNYTILTKKTLESVHWYSSVTFLITFSKWPSYLIFFTFCLSKNLSNVSPGVNKSILLAHLFLMPHFSTPSKHQKTFWVKILSAVLFTFTKEILNGKVYCLCSVIMQSDNKKTGIRSCCSDAFFVDIIGMCAWVFVYCLGWFRNFKYRSR